MQILSSVQRSDTIITHG